MKSIYLDNNATTPIAPEVIEVMSQIMTETFGNPSSLHGAGRDAKVAMENAREICADILGAEPFEIIFCGGGTEADNICLKGVARALKHKRKKIIVTPIEHSAIRQSAKELSDEGFDVQNVEVTKEGIVTPEALAALVDENTSLVSIMYANNEIGVVQDIPALVKIAHARGALFHTDAVQAFGKIPVALDELDVDLLSISAHKIYGPKGVGLVYAKGGVKIAPLIHGGTHEKGRRPGTENVAGIVGLAKAMELAAARAAEEYKHYTQLSERFLGTLRGKIQDITLNGPELSADRITRTPSTVNLSFAGAEGEAIILSLDLEGIAVSSGSACSSGATDPSPVLLAIGQTPELAKSSIRFSMGRSTTEADIDHVCEVLPVVIDRLRSLSPEYARAAGSA